MQWHSNNDPASNKARCWCKEDLPRHVPVLLREVIEWLNVRPGGTYCDLTCGSGGHARAIAEILGPEGRLVAIDIDPAAVRRAQARLRGLPATVIVGDYREIDKHLDNLGVGLVDGWLADLGVSTEQLADPSRGFSLKAAGPLDMRYSDRTTVTAAQIVNEYPERELVRIFRDFEPRWARRIARKIVERRRHESIQSTAQLAELIAATIPAPLRKPSIHPATRVFLALRIAVNAELAGVPPTLRTIVQRSRRGARICILSYHSLEDKAVTATLRDMARKCVCPAGQPVCTCGGPLVKLLTPRPVRPTPQEIERNPRARSAMLRCAERL